MTPSFRTLRRTSESSTAYVAGFAFDDSENGVCTQVALILKARPAWQEGFLNGIGGHIEEGESGHAAMVREFEEETGLNVPNWELFVILQGIDWSVAFYRVFGVDLKQVKTTTDEEVVVVPAHSLPSNVLFNLNWLVPLALDYKPRIPTSVIYA